MKHFIPLKLLRKNSVVTKIHREQQNRQIKVTQINLHLGSVI